MKKYKFKFERFVPRTRIVPGFYELTKGWFEEVEGDRVFSPEKRVLNWQVILKRSKICMK